LEAAHGDLPAEGASLPEVPLSKRLIHQRYWSGAGRVAHREFAPQEHRRAQRLEIAPRYGVEVDLIAAYRPPVDEDILRDSAAGQRRDHGVTGGLHGRQALDLLEQAVIERGGGSAAIPFPCGFGAGEEHAVSAKTGIHAMEVAKSLNEQSCANQ